MLGFPTSCLLDFYGAGENNGGRGTDSRGGRHPNWTNGTPTPTTRQGFLQARCPSCRPTNSVKALKAQNMQKVRRNFKSQNQPVVVRRQKMHTYKEHMSPSPPSRNALHTYMLHREHMTILPYIIPRQHLSTKSVPFGWPTGNYDTSQQFSKLDGISSYV